MQGESEKKPEPGAGTLTGSLKPRTVRTAWFQLFGAFLLFQALVAAFGILIGSSGNDLGLDAAKRLDAMRQAFQSIAAIGVIGCMVYARAKLHPSVVTNPRDLLRATAICLAIGELTLLVSLIGLAKLHLAQFLVACGMVFLVDFALILPAGLRVLNQPAASQSRGNNFHTEGH